MPIDRVRRDPHQPRRDWRANDGYQRLNELTRSVQEFGILQPLVVRQEGAHYVVIAGGRRLVAARRAGMAEVPVIVRNDDTTRVRVLQLVENIQRHELTALDEARAFQELIDLDGMTPPQIALRVRVSEQYVRDRLRILRDQILADAVERRQIAMSVAREINKLSDAAADPLRKRIAAGEKVQLADIQEMRRQLAAAGIVNPRLSPRADRPAPGATSRQAEPGANTASATSGAPDAEPMVTPPPMQPDQIPAWLTQPGRDRSGRTVESALKKIEADYRLYRATGASSPAEGAFRGDTEAGVAFSDLLAGLDRDRLEAVLLFALERGWNIPGLLQNIQEIGR